MSESDPIKPMKRVRRCPRGIVPVAPNWLRWSQFCIWPEAKNGRRCFQMLTRNTGKTQIHCLKNDTFSCISQFHSTDFIHLSCTGETERFSGYGTATEKVHFRLSAFQAWFGYRHLLEEALGVRIDSLLKRWRPTWRDRLVRGILFEEYTYKI